MQWAVVDFPESDSPTTATVMPAWMSKGTSSSTLLW